MIKSSWIIFLIGLLFLDTRLLGEEFSFHELKKITVGPFDNFAGVVDSSGESLVYTQSKYLSTQIRSFNLNSGEDKQLIAIDGDSKNPKLSPDGKFIAFTYFIDDAKGDVCYSPSEKLEIICFTRPNLADHSPVWIGNDKIALISSDDFGNNSVLWTYSLENQKKEILLKGDIFSPSVSKDQNRLIYRDSTDRLNVIDLKTKRHLNSYKLAIPIRMGQAFFGPAGTYIYFTGYSVDTNGDLLIDSRDYGVIYRFQVSAPKDMVVPTQLTSTAYNCSYPFIKDQNLYLTCAFSGSLDIYQTNVSGVVPKNWGEAKLWQAHETARSYEDRLILINQLYTEAKALNFSDYVKRSLFNITLSNDWLAASSYARSLAKVSEPSLANDYVALGNVFKLFAIWQIDQKKSIPSDINKKLAMHIKQMKTEEKSVSADVEKIIAAFQSYMYGQKDKAFSLLKKSEFNDFFHIYLQSYIMRLSYPNQDAYRQFIKKRLFNKKLVLENRVYFLAQYLESIAESNDPMPYLEDLLAKGELEQDFIDVLENEQIVYRLVQTLEVKAQVKLGQSASKIARKLRSSYLFKRLLFSRSMLIYRSKGFAKQQADLSSLWLSLSDKKTTEYPYVIEAFKINTIENGYNFLDPKVNKLNYASGAFFAAIRSTDDLEAHFQYARLSLIKGSKERFTKDYELMLQDGLITEESLRFASLIRGLRYKKEALWPVDKIEEGIDVITRLPDSSNGAGVKYLLLANIFHQKVLDSQKRYSYDRDASEKAHRYYLLAIDLSRDNERVLGAAHLNLGLLHYSIRNYTLAAEYLGYSASFKDGKIKKFLAFSWVYANCLYRAGRPFDAYKVLESTLLIPQQEISRFQEKTAFYAMASARYDIAAKHYLDLAKSLGEQGMSGSMRLSLGFSLYKAKSDDMAARFWLERAIDYADTKGKEKLDKQAEIILHHHVKTKFIAFGLLSQIESLPPKVRIKYLNKRLSLYQIFYEKSDFYQFSDSDLKGQEIKERQKLAVLYVSDNRLAEGQSAMLDSIKLADAYGEDLGYLSYPIQQSFKNAISFSLLVPGIDVPLLNPTVGKLFDAMISESKEQRSLSDDVWLSFGKSVLLYNAFRIHQSDTNSKVTLFRQNSDKWLTSEPAKALQKSNAEYFKDLQSYRDAVSSKL